MLPTQFTDTRNHTWDVTLTLASAKRIDAADFSLIWNQAFTILDPSKELFGKLASDKRLAIAMAYHIIRPKLDTIADYRQVIENTTEDYERRIATLREHHDIAFPGTPYVYTCIPLSDEIEVALENYWSEAIDGRVLNDACNALWESLCFFFPSNQNTIRAFKEIQQKNLNLIEKELLEVMNQVAPLIESDTKKKVAAIMSKIKQDFTDSPGVN